MPTRPLENWTRTTLWFRTVKPGENGPVLHVEVVHPPSITAEERKALLAKHASQSVRIMRELTGTKDVILQGLYVAGKARPVDTFEE